MHELIERLGLQHPIVQAPMAGTQGSRLAIAVCETGALGSLPCALLSIEQMRAELHAIRAATSGAYNVNFFCHQSPVVDDARESAWRAALQPYYDECGVSSDSVKPAAQRMPFNDAMAEALSEFAPRVASFHFGLPSRALVDRVKQWGAMVWSSATTVDEARWLEANGADVIIAQGNEAGGHRGMFLSTEITTQIGTLALLPQIVAAVRVPVTAAGGIADAAGVRAALALGAAAVQIGTSFMLCDECDTTPLHRAALKSTATSHTALTNVFTGRPARSIVNRAVREIGPISEHAPEFPLAAGAIGPLRTSFEARGSGDFSPLWCGQNASGMRETSAKEIVRALGALGSAS
jgi:nitronate monooxygenase